MSAEAYWKLIERTGEGCYFLWGPIRNALLMEFTEGNVDLIASICTDGPLTKDRRMPVARKDMLIQVLTIAGQERRDEVCAFSRQVIKPRPRWQQPVEPRSLVEAKKVVAQVAGQLHLSDILKQLILDRDEDVRRTAVRSTFYLWKEEKSSSRQKEELSSIRILKELGDPKAVSHWVIPSRRQLQSCFELTLSILFEDYADPETTAILQAIWAGILGKLLWQQTSHDGGGQSFSSRAVRLARSSALRMAVSLVIRLARNLEEERMSVYDVRELERFFQSSREVKERFRRLVPYIHPSTGSLEDIISDLKLVVKGRDVLSSYLLLLVLGAHIHVRPKDTAAVIKELFEGVIGVKPALPSIPMLIIALSNTCDGKDADEIDTQILQLEEDCIVRYQERHDSISYGQTGVRFVYSGLSSYPQYPYKKYGKVNESVLNAFVDNAKIGSGYDHRKIHNYMVNVAVPGHPDYRDIGAILESLEPILRIAFDDRVSLEELNRAQARFKVYGPDKVDDFMKKEKDFKRKIREVVVFQEYLIDALARIQVYAPGKVDHFMDMQSIPSELQERVRNKSSEEEMASAVMGRGVFFVRDAILLQPDSQLSQIFIRWFEQAPDCSSFAEWISAGIKMVLNTLCNDDLFQL